VTEEQHSVAKEAMQKPSYTPDDWMFETAAALAEGSILTFVRYQAAHMDQMRYLERAEIKRQAQALFRKLSGKDPNFKPRSAEISLWDKIASERKFTFVVAQRVARQGRSIMDATTALDVIVSDTTMSASEKLALMAAKLGINLPVETDADREDRELAEELAADAQTNA